MAVAEESEDAFDSVGAETDDVDEASDLESDFEVEL